MGLTHDAVGKTDAGQVTALPVFVSTGVFKKYIEQAFEIVPKI